MRQVIGLDVGGSKISGIVFDGKTVVRELTVATPKNLNGFKKAVAQLLDFLSSGKQIAGLGVGMAGRVNEKGVVFYNPNLKFLINFNVEKFFKSFGFKKLVIDNDANCFALAELAAGKGQPYRNFVALTLGTGVGGGIVLNKKLYTGSHDSAGEAGHMMADFTYSIEHHFQKARDKKDFKKLGEIVGLLFANIVNLLDVDAIVLGGTVSIKHHDQFMPYALKAAKKHIVNKSGMPKIVVSNLKDSGSIGAAFLLKDKLT